MDSEKDKKVKRIARFLELGGTMLAEHCKICGAPKFRYQGTIICPICDVEEEGETQEPTAGVQVPEARQSMEKHREEHREKEGAKEGEIEREKERLSLQGEKKAQARMQEEPHFGMRSAKTPVTEEKDFEEKVPSLSYKAGKSGKHTPAVQAAPSEKIEKPVETSRLSGLSGAHEDRKMLESLLFKKMVSIAASLQDETDPRSIIEDLELIEKSLGLVERLRQL